MAYSKSRTTLENSRPYWEKLLTTGTDQVSWYVETPELADKLAFKLREALQIAVRYESEYPDLAALKGRVRLRLDGHYLHARILQRGERFGLVEGKVQIVQSVAVPGQFMGATTPLTRSSAEDDGLKRAEAEESKDWDMTAIVGEWTQYKPAPQNKAWRWQYPTIEQLIELKNWAHGQGLIVMYSHEVQGTLTLVQYDAEIAQYEWNENEEREAQAKRVREVVKENPFNLLRRAYGSEDVPSGDPDDRPESGVGHDESAGAETDARTLTKGFTDVSGLLD